MTSLVLRNTFSLKVDWEALHYWFKSIFFAGQTKKTVTNPTVFECQAPFKLWKLNTSCALITS